MTSPEEPPSSFTTSTPPVPRQTSGSIAPQPISTPTHGAGGSFTIYTSTHIAAPPDTVFAILAEHSKWPEWNRFVRQVTVDSCPPPTEADPDAAALETTLQGDDGTTYLKKGMAMTFNVHMDPENASSHTKQGMLVTVLEPYEVGNEGKGRGWRIAWKSTSYPSFVLRSERVQEVVDDGEGGSEYTCWETMYGPLAPVVKLAVGQKLEKGFECWTHDLKERSEGYHETEGTVPPSSDR